MNRLLIIPLISSRTDLFRESDFLTWLNFAKQWPNITIYIPVSPDALIPDECKLPNLLYVPIKSWYPYAASQGMISSEFFELFNPVDGRIQVDAILTSKSVIAANLKRLFWVSAQLNIPVIIAEAWVQAPTDGDLKVQDKLRSVSYSECKTIYPTKREKMFAMDVARRYLSASSLLACDKLSEVRSQGINAELVQTIAHSVEKFEKFTLVFAGRLNNNKRWRDIFTVYEDIFKLTPDVDIKAICLGSSLTEDDKKRFSKIEFLKPMPYNEYLELISKSHLSLSMSRDEGFSFGWGEQICTGNPVLFPDKSWADDLLDDKSYPFVYNTRDELYAMIKWVKLNYASARAKVASTAKKFVETHEISKVAGEYLSIITKEIPNTYMVFEEWSDRWRESVDEMPESFRLRDLIKYASVKYKAGFGNYVVLQGAYRNIYMELCKYAKPDIGKDTWSKHDTRS